MKLVGLLFVLQQIYQRGKFSINYSNPLLSLLRCTICVKNKINNKNQVVIDLEVLAYFFVCYQQILLLEKVVANRDLGRSDSLLMFLSCAFSQFHLSNNKIKLKKKKRGENDREKEIQMCFHYKQNFDHLKGFRF